MKPRPAEDATSRGEETHCTEGAQRRDDRQV